MSQLFVSHSAGDDDIVAFFSKVAAGTRVRLVFEEFERLTSGEVNAQKIQAEIQESAAVFLLLGPHVQSIPHTRDWVVWESGVAHNKDVWVFERARDYGQIQVVTPVIRHYVLYETDDAWFPYIRRVIESYDDSHVLGTAVLSAGVGALFGRGSGAVAGALAGLALAASSKNRPSGLEVCCGKCRSWYHAYLPQRARYFRCPVCNSLLSLEA